MFYLVPSFPIADWGPLVIRCCVQIGASGAIAEQYEAVQIQCKDQAHSLRVNIAFIQRIPQLIVEKREIMQELLIRLQRAKQTRTAAKLATRTRRDAVLEAHRKRFDADLEDTP